MTPFHRTIRALRDGAYGFTWDGLEIIRTASVNGHKILTLRTDRQTVDIRITPTGLIRIPDPYKTPEEPSDA